MTWLQIPSNLQRDPRIHKAARLLGVQPTTIVGQYVALTSWLLDFVESGDISKFDPVDIAEAAMWDSDPQQLIEAYAAAGLIKDNRFTDWDTVAGRLLQRRETERQRIATKRSVGATLHQQKSTLPHETRVEKSKTKRDPTDPVDPVIEVKSDNKVSIIPSRPSAKIGDQDNAQKTHTVSERTAIKTALVAACGYTPATSAEWKPVELAVTQILSADGTAEQVQERYKNLSLHWPNITITPNHLGSRWGLAEHPPSRASPSSNGSKPRQGGRAVDKGDRELIEEMQRAEHSR